ncbi:MAG: biotin/methionine sulfoxide reductase [Verrucomicrobiales bacterium]
MERTGTTLTHWGAFTVTSKDGVVISVEPAANDPDPSPIGQKLARSNEHRVLEPSIRSSWLETGPFSAPERRGLDPFVEVSWDVALDLAADVLERTRTDAGNGAIFGGSYGWASAGRFHHAPSQLKRFLNCIGGFVGSVGTYSHGAAEVVAPRVLGIDFQAFLRVAPPLSDIAEHSDLLVSFGGFPASNTQISSGGDAQHWYRPELRRAAENGCRFVSISPLQGEFDRELGAEWFQIRPGTDAALMLGMCGELVERGLHADAFLSQYCSGASHLIDYLLGRTDGVAKNAAWAAEICGLEAAAIRSLAADIVTSRTTVNATWSTQRVENGEQAVWALIALGCFAGQMDMPGGGIAFGYGSMGSMGDALTSDYLPFLDQGTNAVGRSIPVSRIADCLLHPGSEYSFNGVVDTYPDIDLIYWCGGNPYHHHQDLNRLHRAWSNAAAVLVHEPFWTATAQRADIVLPATIGPERTDFGGTRYGSSLVAMDQVLDPPGRAQNDFWIFSQLARRLGCESEFTKDRSVGQWLTSFYEDIRATIPDLPSYDSLREQHIVERPRRSRPETLVAFFADPDGHPLDTPSGRIELSLDDHVALLGQGSHAHPAWRPPVSWLGNATEEEFHLISPMPPDRLHAQYGFDETSVQPVLISPTDVQRLGIVQGDLVRIWNERGECFCAVEVTTSVRSGVLSVENGRWFTSPDPVTGISPAHGNPNTLTEDRATSSWGQATAAHSCLVRITPTSIE